MLAAVDFRPPRIVTPRLALRGYELTDAPAIFHYSSDPETTRFMAWPRAESADDILGFLNGVVANEYRDRNLSYAITKVGDESTVIGGAGLSWREQAKQEMDFGYILRRDHWGRGLIVEAGRALLGLAFAQTTLARVVAPVFTPNLQSRRVAEKMGFRVDRTLPADPDDFCHRFETSVYVISRRAFMSSAKELDRIL